MKTKNIKRKRTAQPGGSLEPVGSATLRYAQSLATTIWEKHWKQDAPNWKPLDDVLGVLTQIDNMVAGMTRPNK
jgi:hypothetical protein